MKPIFLGLAAVLTTLGALHGQNPLEDRLTADLKPAPKQFGEVSEEDKKLVIRKVASLLGQHVTFRNDGVAASYYQSTSGRHYVEWQNLRIKMLVPTRAHPDDATKGVDKRIQALLTYDACRILNPKTNSWNAWSKKGHPLFPPAVNFAWQNGHVMTDGGYHLPKFHKGPVASQATATAEPFNPKEDPIPGSADVDRAPTQGTIQRGTGGLPPGMKRN